jgi:hypothetical protein
LPALRRAVAGYRIFRAEALRCHVIHVYSLVDEEIAHCSGTAFREFLVMFQAPRRVGVASDLQLR